MSLTYAKKELIDYRLDQPYFDLECFLMYYDFSRRALTRTARVITAVVTSNSVDVVLALLLNKLTGQSTTNKLVQLGYLVRIS